MAMLLCMFLIGNTMVPAQAGPLEFIERHLLGGTLHLHRTSSHRRRVVYRRVVVDNRRRAKRAIASKKPAASRQITTNAAQRQAEIGNKPPANPPMPNSAVRQNQVAAVTPAHRNPLPIGALLEHNPPAVRTPGPQNAVMVRTQVQHPVFVARPQVQRVPTAATVRVQPSRVIAALAHNQSARHGLIAQKAAHQPRQANWETVDYPSFNQRHIAERAAEINTSHFRDGMEELHNSTPTITEARPVCTEHATRRESNDAAFATRASWYGPGFNGRRTADGARFNEYGLTAASRTLPFGSKVLVANPKSGRCCTVTINDRGPYVSGRDLDLSKGAAAKIGVSGVSPVICVAYANPREAVTQTGTRNRRGYRGRTRRSSGSPPRISSKVMHLMAGVM